MVEAKLVDRLLSHLVRPNMTVTDVNRLLSVGSYIVADRLGLIGKARKKGGKVKPHWQRRLERSIAEWRKDLSQVDEIRKHPGPDQYREQRRGRGENRAGPEQRRGHRCQVTESNPWYRRPARSFAMADRVADNQNDSRARHYQ